MASQSNLERDFRSENVSHAENTLSFASIMSDANERSSFEPNKSLQRNSDQTVSGFLDFGSSNIYGDTQNNRQHSESIIMAGKPASGDFPDVQANPQWYSLGHREPSGNGDKIVVTGPTEDAPTGWNQVIANLSRTGGWDVSANNSDLRTMIDNVIAEYNRDGQPFKQVVFRSHGYPGALSIGGHDYELSDPAVISEFARLRTSGALAAGAQIELQGCNLASNVDQSYAPNRDALQRLSNATGADVEAGVQMQRANRFGWTGQVVRFSPER